MSISALATVTGGGATPFNGVKGFTLTGAILGAWYNGNPVSPGINWGQAFVPPNATREDARRICQTTVAICIAEFLGLTNGQDFTFDPDQVLLLGL